jgi:hypothetical protein
MHLTASHSPNSLVSSRRSWPELDSTSRPALRKLCSYSELTTQTVNNVSPSRALDDDSNSLTLPSDPPVPVKTTWTLLLYLTSASEGCVGGETVFYPHDRQLAAEEIAVPLETGMLLLHKHGDDCLLVSYFDVVFRPHLLV